VSLSCGEKLLRERELAIQQCVFARRALGDSRFRLVTNDDGPFAAKNKHREDEQTPTSIRHFVTGSAAN